MVDTIEITYCTEWNYLPVASSLAAAIKERYGIKVKLKKGHNAVLRVTVNNAVIYDNKSVCGRLPSVDEIIQIIEITQG